MIVPFVHRWMVWVDWWGESATSGRRAAMREPRVACAGGSRQAAMTSTSPARETRAGIPQLARVMRIGLSFRSGSDKFSEILIHRGGSLQRGFAPAADT